MSIDYPHNLMDDIANRRYVVKKSISGIYPYAVFAGDGEQQLYCGSLSECEVVARKLMGAFLDGGFIFAGILEGELTAAMQPLDSIRWWIAAYSNPENGPSYQGHGMLVQLLTEYQQLRITLSRWKYD